MRIFLLILLLVTMVSAWELVLDASCSSCGFYQKDIVIKPGTVMAPCPVCGIVVTKFRNTTVGGGECKICGSWLLFYPDYLGKLSWWQTSESSGEPRRNSPSIYICPVCGSPTLNFVCTKRKN